MIFKLTLFINLALMSQSVWANNFLIPTENDSLPHIAGPNCWNQALMSVSLLDSPRFTSAEEFIYLVEAHCEQVAEPSYGSLGRMQDDQGEVHAFIYISESEVFAKNSMGALERSGFMSFESMFETYLVKDNEQCSVSSKSLVPDLAPSCTRQTSYYNCNSLMPEIQKQQLELQDLDRILYQIVFSFETMARPRYSCEAEFLKRRFSLVKSLIEQIQVFKKQGQIFEFSYLQAWAVSARLQIDEIERSSFSERCMTSSSEYLNSYQVFQAARESLATILR